MPSDPSGRFPIGVLARPAPDFFDDNLGAGGAFIFDSTPPAGNAWVTYALYNNDAMGRSLKVYGVSVYSQGGGGLVFGYSKGIVGTFAQNCVAISPDVGIPPGQIYTQLSDGHASPIPIFIPAIIVGAIAAAGFDSGTQLSPFPLFKVPAGYSLVGTNPSSTLISYCTFWFQVSNE